MASLHQQHVANYHAAMSHGGHHDMHLFHRNWHQVNRDPVRPPLLPNAPNRQWGMNLVFGTNFLQMHHEMVKAAPSEQRFHMMHDSLIAWYQQQSLALPAEWNPLQPIPAELAYDPDLETFPTEIRNAVIARAQADHRSPEQVLTRRTDNPQFLLPKYFTRVGVASGESGEPITGARKLADFQNTNQLGCCLVFPHNQWHGEIGGAMGSTWTAIADPIFYFGVHWHIDRIFDDYKVLQAERRIHPLDRERLLLVGALPSEAIDLPRAFTAEQQRWLEEGIRQSERLHAAP